MERNLPYLKGDLRSPCIVCGKSVSRGRRLSHLCSYKCARQRRQELRENLKRRMERQAKPPRQLTKRLGERITGFFNSLFEGV